MGVVDDGGCERVGFGVVDHAQIDRRCLVVGFRSVEFREFIPSG